MQDNKFEISYSAEALAELNNIWDYSSRKWSTTQAEIYLRKLNAAFEQIARNPRYGRRYEGVPIELLGYKAESHVIFYTVSPDSIKIMRIMHGRMNFRGQFRKQR